MPDGVLNIDKPAGMTSHDVVARVRRIAKMKRVGHAGTLDPDATGVLLVCLGQATRLADYLAAEGKVYRGTLELGSTTSTEDASGEVLTECDASHITEADLRAILPQFTGEISQIPPMVSAVHHEGKRLYQLARQGIEVERQARTIQIDALTLLSFTSGPKAQAVLDVHCGKGTYIRTLCADLGAALGVGGHMAELRRTKIGSFSVDRGLPLSDLTEETLASALVSPSDALPWMPLQSVISESDLSALGHGKAIPTEMTDAEIVRMVGPEGRLLALGRAEGGYTAPIQSLSD